MAAEHNIPDLSADEWDMYDEEVFDDKDTLTEVHGLFANVDAAIKSKEQREREKIYVAAIDLLDSAGVSKDIQKDEYYRSIVDGEIMAVLASPLGVSDQLGRRHSFIRLTFNTPSIDETTHEPVLRIHDYFIDFDHHFIFGAEEILSGEPIPGSAFSDSKWERTNDSPPSFEYDEFSKTLTVRHSNEYETRMRQEILAGINRGGEYYLLHDAININRSDHEPLQHLVMS